MKDEDIYKTEQVPTSATWQQYYPSPQDVPYGYQFNENQALANALRGYDQEESMRPITYMPGYEDTLTRKLLEKKDANLTTTQPYQRGGGMQMPMNMNFMGAGAAVNPKSFGQDTSLPQTTSETQFTDGNAPFGSTGSADVTSNSYVGSQMDAAESPGMFGNGGSLGGGWMSGVAGGMAGANQGHENYVNDPKMHSTDDGFNKYHRDYRAELGGGMLGGVLGYWGGPIGAAAAGPVVKAVHPTAERFSRNMVKLGDKWGGATGAMIADPAAAVGSGKYSWGEIAQVPFTKKLFGW